MQKQNKCQYLQGLQKHYSINRLKAIVIKGDQQFNIEEKFFAGFEQTN